MKIRGNTVGTTIKPEAIKDKLGIPEGEGGGEGLSDTSKSLLIAILRNAVYTSNQKANITALDAELNKTTPHTHSYTSSVTTQATCTTDGVRTHICSCGHSYTEAIPATGHKYVDGVCSVCGASDPNHGGTEGGETHTHSYSSSVTKEATCTTEGVRTYTCSCGHTYTEPIPATGHNFVDGTCTICGEADPNHVALTSISVTYSGSDVVVGTALTDLSGIVVTATYSNGTTEEVTDYTLTGTIAEGSNTITVVYEGKTTTFIVIGELSTWHYEWSADSGVAPVTYNGETADGEWVEGLYALTADYEFAPIGDIEVEIEFKTEGSKQMQSPQFGLCYSYGKGFKVFNNVNGRISTSLSGANEDLGVAFPINTLQTFIGRATSAGCGFEFAGMNMTGDGLTGNNYIDKNAIAINGTTVHLSKLRCWATLSPKDIVNVNKDIGINWQTGEAVSESGKASSDYIEISAPDMSNLYIASVGCSIVGRFYDSNHAYLSSVSTGVLTDADKTINASNATYVRIEVRNFDASAVSLGRVRIGSNEYYLEVSQ